MKSKKLFYNTLIWSVIVWTNTSLGATPPAEPINKIVAVVNQEIITENELQDAVHSVQAHYEKLQLAYPDQITIQKNALQALIYQKLQLDLAKQNHIKINSQQVSQAIQRIAEEHHISLADLQEKLAAEGISFHTFQDQIQQQLTMLNLQQKAIAGKINITDEDVKEWAEKNNLPLLEAKQALYQQKFQIALKEWLDTLQNSAYIKIYA